MDTFSEILNRYTVQGGDATNKVLGAAFVVGLDNAIVYSGHAGQQDFAASSGPFTAQTLTWIASMTKVITTTCVMQLVERGLLSLDEDIRDRAPELYDMRILRGFTEQGDPILEENDRAITVRMLLTHTVGIAADFLDPATTKWSKSIGRTAWHMSWNRQGFTTPFRFAPGEGWLYGSGVDWAGLVLEQVTGTRLGEYMQQHIFEPLGMHDSGFWPDKLPETASRRAGWSRRNAVTGVLEPGTRFTPEYHEVEAGGTGIYSTAADFATFLLGLTACRLISRTIVDAMFTPQLLPKQKAMMNKHVYHPVVRNTFTPEFPNQIELDFGLGGLINMVDVPGKRRAGSMAWNGLINSRWWIDRDTGIVATLVVNILPHGDQVVARMYDELERAVYKNLNVLKQIKSHTVISKM